jgi:hypothetical protein
MSYLLGYPDQPFLDYKIILLGETTFIPLHENPREYSKILEFMAMLNESN